MSDSEDDFIYEDEDEFYVDKTEIPKLTQEEEKEKQRYNSLYQNREKIFLTDRTIKIIMNDIKEFDRGNMKEHSIFLGELPDDFSHVDLYLRFDNESKLGRQLNEHGKKIKEEKQRELMDEGIDKKDVDLFLEEDTEIEFSDALHVRVEFDDEYPMKAPFARIVKPLVQTTDHHFAVFGGALCFNFLSKFGVNPTQHFQDIFISVKPLLELNLEVIDFTKEFSRDEAVTGYKRINNFHSTW